MIITSPYHRALISPGMPLTMLIQQQLENSFGCSVLCLSMSGHLTGSSEAAGLLSSGESLSVAEASSGKYRILFMHPEASITETGQQLLRELAKLDVIHGLFIDEVHQVHSSDCQVSMLDHFFLCRDWKATGPAFALAFSNTFWLLRSTWPNILLSAS